MVSAVSVLGQAPVMWRPPLPRVDSWQEQPSTLILDSTFRWDPTDSVFRRLGWSRVEGDSDCWENTQLGRSIWTACANLRLEVDHDGRNRLTFLDRGRARTTTIPRHLVAGRLRFLTMGGSSSSGMFNSPNLSGFLLQAWWQQIDSAGMADRVVWRIPIERSRSGLLARLAGSARWGIDYLEEDNPFVLDRPVVRPVGHFIGWFADALAWGAVIGTQFQPGLRPMERVVLASATLGIGAGVRLAIAGWPMSAELEFRNRMAGGPYRWPEAMIPAGPGTE